MYKANYISGLLLSTVLIVSCTAEENEQNQDSEGRTVSVESELIHEDTFESFLRQVGTVISDQDVVISAEVGGRITEIMKREGDRVESGETILKIDDRRLQQEMNRLAAATEQSRENFERLKRLYEEDRIGSEIEYLNAKYTYEQNLASLESVKIDLENSTVSSPFGGVIENIMMERGEMVSAGTSLIRMISDGGKKITLGVPARFSNVVDLGDEAEIWFDFEDDKRYKLPITYIGNSIDPQNRTFRVDIALPAGFRDIKIDMIANVRLRTEYMEEVIIISEEYIFQKNGNYVAYIMGGEDAAEEKIVETGPSYGNNTVITSGLTVGERLITVGSSYLQDGTRVNLVENRASQFTEN